jgi:hypothetical protein
VVHVCAHVPAALQRNGVQSFLLPSAAVDARPSSAHVALFSGATHCPSLQANPFAHPASPLQLLKQPVGSQANGAHDSVFGTAQEPFPSQRPLDVKRAPAHVGSAHFVSNERANLAQRVGSKPSHVVSAHELAAAAQLRAPRGLPATVVHVPTEPGSLHDSHVPSHARSQQTPSTQGPSSQSVLVAQVAPPRLPNVRVRVLMRGERIAGSVSKRSYTSSAFAPESADTMGRTTSLAP